MEVQPYPYIPGEKGIPFEEIFSNFRNGVKAGSIQAGSGAELRYEIDTKLLFIQDRQYVDRLMGASVEEGVAKFEIQTRRSDLDIIRMNFPWERHPDMYASRFIGVALAFFEQNGEKVEACWGYWKPRGFNHQQFEEQLRVTGDLKTAALSTDSARMFGKYGYVGVGSVVLHPLFNGRIIEARFVKPT